VDGTGAGTAPDGGATLVELVVAITILAIVLFAAAIALSGAVRSELSTRRADAALRLAHDAAERATVFDCGVLPALTTDVVLDRQLTRCQGSLGTRTWSTAVDGMPYDLRLDVQWVQIRPNPAAPVACDRLRLQRAVTVSWTEGSVRRQRRVELLAALPVDSVAQLNAGQLDLRGPAGGTAALALPGGRRYPVSLDTSGRGLIPFLATGSAYTVLDVASGASVTTPPIPATAGACSVVTVTVP
jgi:hypothetical protein